MAEIDPLDIEEEKEAGALPAEEEVIPARSTSKREKDPLSKLLSEHTHPSKDKDQLLHIYIGNPLKRITELLEEIKKQKAFSFTLRGSLGIAGAFLAISVFGIFGGGKLLCEKGVQTHVGTVRILNILETESKSDIPILSMLTNYFGPRHTYNRMVLVEENGDDVVNLPYSRYIDITPYKNMKVAATGNFDSCSQTLTITNASGIETF